MDGRRSYPQPDLIDAVQSLFEDMLLTLLSEPTLVAAETQAFEYLKSKTMIVYIFLLRSLASVLMLFRNQGRDVKYRQG